MPEESVERGGTTRLPALQYENARTAKLDQTNTAVGAAQSDTGAAGDSDGGEARCGQRRRGGRVQLGTDPEGFDVGRKFDVACIDGDPELSRPGTVFTSRTVSRRAGSHG